jgi:hypothetical protein
MLTTKLYENSFFYNYGFVEKQNTNGTVRNKYGWSCDKFVSPYRAICMINQLNCGKLLRALTTLNRVKRLKIGQSASKSYDKKKM